MAAATILNLLLSPILITWCISSSDWLHFCKIALIYISRSLSYYFLCNNLRRQWTQSLVLFLFNIMVLPDLGS